ncbi:hypothetical protein FDP41_009639 [Naegleria fowleri]|uniref:Protein SDA1 n=1 Tax=Naegleria fowleri TaxID=5763 RepID=A0A6A5AUU1_NAEFO|nr:uncharacterized protein FDP41_009639 [Naegleria fowleri]KAF0971943.1 hypothetical protein FDP41_009639 [Naegleria fowleri]CAG4716021.1 unnamed protein product [Naegleria fowleri]
MSIDLLHLQEQVFKDPKAYRDDFLLQLKHLENQTEIAKLRPSDESKYFIKLLQFLSVACKVFKNDTKPFAVKVLELLETKQQELEPKLRRQLAITLIAFRNNDILDSKTLIPVLFKLFRVHDKTLRSMVYKHILSDITKINMKKKNPNVNRSLQNFVFSMLKDSFRIAAKKSLQLLITLYRRNIWNDDRCVNVISQSCFSDDTALVVIALKFFLGEQVEDPDEEEEKAKQKNDDRDLGHLIRDLKFKVNNIHSKKTKKKEHKFQKALKQLKKKDKHKEKGMEIESLNTLNMLNDPQGFAEKLFAKLKTSNEKFEVRILMMDVISRCISSNNLIVLNFYPFVQKYLLPSQANITKILAITAQSVHDLVPPDVIHPVVMTIANNFANDHSKPEVIAAGLNTIRVMCSRQPRVMTKTLLRDLSQYSKHKDKQVFHAARGIITLFRELSPKMLAKKDRGKNHDPEAAIPEYGTLKVAEGVEGIELLEEYEKRKESEKDLIAIEGEDDDEEWIDVSDDENETVSIPMDEDDEEDDEQDDEEGGEVLNLEDVFELDSDEEEVMEDEEQEEEKPKGPRMDHVRILTQEDFDLIKKLKKSKEMEKLMGNKRKRVANLPAADETVDEDDIGDISKGDESDKEQQEEPETKKFKRRHWDQPGTTNHQKKKNKPYMMLKMSRSVRHKNTMGQNEKKVRKKLSEKRQLKHKLKHR